jgi:predicted DCC family thiol-disulfide oxidoreductase YuxK
VTWTLVYDGNCRVCTRIVNVLRHWDRGGEIEFMPSQSSGVPERFPWIPPSAFREAMQLIGPESRTWAGAAAIEQLLNILPRGRMVGWLFHLPFGRTIIDRF